MRVRVPESGAAGRGLRLVVAGGGTGGHLFPGIAVAQAFQARNPANQVLFVNAGRPLEVEVLSRLGWPFRTIPIEGIKQRRIWHQAAAALKIPNAVRLSAGILKRYRPDLVLGVGGYSAGPVVAAAWLMGLPTALHEQNELPGVTNRLVGRIADRIYLSFARSADRFNPDKVVISGNPVRQEILMLADPLEETRMPGAFTVLVVGGSQGAHAINQAMVDALPRLVGLEGLRIIHQTGTTDVEWVGAAYAAAGIGATVAPFFDQMAEHYRQADLIVCRAGATTVAEITVVGRAAIFIPFPFAADDHQTRNAQALVEAGAAQMIAQSALTGAVLADKITIQARDRSGLARMSARARALGRPEAARTIVEDMCRMLEESRARG
jgi:UDP-N-acetylglucosamine--N-acetylmuramyl-(pentapeptide) pyrophosphoryl-undecaprenol N-acetylglucosamine transferase